MYRVARVYGGDRVIVFTRLIGLIGFLGAIRV